MKLSSVIVIALATFLPTLVVSTGLRSEESQGERSLTNEKKGKSDKDSKNRHVAYIKKDDFYFGLRSSQFNGRCLAFDPRDDYYVKFVDCHDSNAAFLDWYYDPFHYTINSLHYNYRDWCLTLDNPRNSRRNDRSGYLYLAKCNGSEFQEWYETHDYRFESGWDRNQCMDYCRDCGHYVHTRRCDSDHDKDQQFRYGDKFHFY